MIGGDPMTNFSFLKEKNTYALFAPACVEAERIFAASPAMCAVGCRKGLGTGGEVGLCRRYLHGGALSGQPPVPPP